MAKFKINGVELDAPDNLPLRQIIEAEKALGFSMDASWGAGMAVALFIALRNNDPDKHPALLADEVLATDLAQLEEVEAESPPVETGGPDDSETSGPPRLVSTA